jgi:hypothetical protein
VLGLMSPSRSQLGTWPLPERLARQVPREVHFPSAAVPVRQDSPPLERQDLPLPERPDSRRVKLRAERFVVAREIAQAKLA